MPATFSPASHKAESFDFHISNTKRHPSISEYVLQGACSDQYEKADEILQSSFSRECDESKGAILPRKNGFVSTITQAYNRHQSLVIRPDDVWLAILTQFNFYVNGNAELLRSQFVQHEGKKELAVKAVGSRYTVDFGHMAHSMTDLIQENVVDPSLRDWILPDFSTTTLNDTIVCSVVMMATMKEYFSYSFSLMCGIPSVTLEGERSDWVKILSKLEKLKEYGPQTIAWYHLLYPVLSRFIKAFDDPNGKENIDFWQRVVHYEGGGSGPTFLSGWITAFCAFNEKGQWMGENFPKLVEYTLTDEDLLGSPCDDPTLTIDGVRYHSVDTSIIPSGFAEVDVKLDDNGQQFDTVLTAGSVAMRVYDSGDTQLSQTGKQDRVEPVAGWWIFTTKAEKATLSISDERQD